MQRNAMQYNTIEYKYTILFKRSAIALAWVSKNPLTHHHHSACVQCRSKSRLHDLYTILIFINQPLMIWWFVNGTWFSVDRPSIYCNLKKIMFMILYTTTLNCETMLRVWEVISGCFQFTLRDQQFVSCNPREYLTVFTDLDMVGP